MKRRADPGQRAAVPDRPHGLLCAGPSTRVHLQRLPRGPGHTPFRKGGRHLGANFSVVPYAPSIRGRCHHTRISQKSHCHFLSFHSCPGRHHPSRPLNQPPVFDFLDDSKHTDYGCQQRTWQLEVSWTLGNQQSMKEILPIFCGAVSGIHAYDCELQVLIYLFLPYKILKIT